MNLALYHGRLHPDQGGTDSDGNPSDDWGFVGPVLFGVRALDFTYGSFQVVYEDNELGAMACAAAHVITGWRPGTHSHSLEIYFEGAGYELIKIWNAERARHEYFGDWWLVED